jgi:hypothetical protein
MKRMLGFVVLVLFPSILAADSRLVRLRVIDGDEPQKGVSVRVVTPHPGRSNGDTAVLTTDSRGFVEFRLEHEVFWVAVPALNSEVTGRFDVARNAPKEMRWDMRPREWSREEVDQ